MQEDAIIETAICCYHCGDECNDDVLYKDEKAFCCRGCSTVYTLLKEHELSDYYQIASAPGIKKSKEKRTGKYAWLDEADIRDELIRFNNGTLSTVVFRIPSIHCSSCIWLLENLYKLSEGVQSSTVNFMRKEISIRFDEKVISLRQLVELVDSIGYEPEINIENKDKQAAHINRDRSLFYKIGIAGFCFGNIMLLSFPEYLGLNHIGGIAFRELFGYLNLLLALPVFFYCAIDYYRSAWTGLRQKELNLDLPITLGIIALFGRSAYEILSATGSGYMDSLAGLLFFMLIGKWFQSRTYEQLSFERDYKSYFPIAVTRLNNGKKENIAIEKAEVGDILKIYHEELIPADAYLLDDKAAIDYSFVSGESDPVMIKNGQSIFAGGRLKSPSIKIRVKNKVSQSYLTSLWNQESIQQTNKNERSLADKLSRYFTPAVLLIAILTAIYWGMEDWGKAVLAFTSVLIVACPCALALSSPFTLGNAMRMLGRSRFYLKNPWVIERMAEATHIVFDKTGTLSLSENAKVEFIGNELSLELKAKIAELCAQSAHPVSRLIVDYLGVQNGAASLSHFREIPGKGLEALLNGDRVKVGKAAFIGLDDRKALNAKSYVSVNGAAIGYFTLAYQYRKGLSGLIQKLKNRYKLSLLSGDHDTDSTLLRKWFGEEVPLYFRQSPHDKFRYIERLKEKGNKVIMVGDGLNDAGALMKSDVGIAVADSINNFSPACDVIMDGTELNKLDKFLNYSKKSIALVKVAFIISLLYNTIGIGFAVAGMLSPLLAAILMPLSSISIVAFGTSSTWLLAKKHRLQNPIDKVNINKKYNTESNRNIEQKLIQQV
ncbi:MAG: heavy metal translocating P-type ATPase metal-binding domain-containing protein [Chitinophagales bacterium]